MIIKYVILFGGCRVDIIVDFFDVCVFGKVVIMVFWLDVVKILDDVCMIFGDVVILFGKVVVVFVDVNIIFGDDDLIFCDVSGFFGFVVLIIFLVVMFVSLVWRFCFVVNFVGEVIICVVEFLSIFDVIFVVKEEWYFEIVVVFFDVIVVFGKVVWVIWFVGRFIL